MATPRKPPSKKPPLVKKPGTDPAKEHSAALAAAKAAKDAASTDGVGPDGSPRPASPASVDLHPDHIAALVGGSHPHPHDALGQHPVDGGFVIRVVRPLADAVTAIRADGTPHRARARRRRALAGHRARRPARRTRSRPRTRTVRAWTADDPYRFVPSVGEVDLYLWGEGRHEQLWHVLGAHYRPHEDVQGTSFSVWAPHAKAARVVGDFNEWNGVGHAMRRLDDKGVWELFIPGMEPNATYKFELLTPSGTWVTRADPMARWAEVPPATASKVVNSIFTWSDTTWMDARTAARPAQRADERVRGASRQLAAGPRLPRRRRRAHRLPGRDRVHARRVPAAGRASIRRVVGVPGHRVLRADQPLRPSRRPEVPHRPPAQRRLRRDHGLGARPLRHRRVGARAVRRRAALRALRPAARRAQGLGHLRLQLRRLAGAQLPGLERAVLAGGVPHRRPAGGCRRLDHLPRLLPQGGRVGAEQATAGGRTWRRSASCRRRTRPRTSATRAS